MWPLEFDRVAPSRTLLTRAKRESKTGEARHALSAHRASSCPSWDRTRTLLIQSAGPRALKTDKLTGRGVPTSIGALSVWHLCPLRSGETLAKHLQRVLAESPDEWVRTSRVGASVRCALRVSDTSAKRPETAGAAGAD